MKPTVTDPLAGGDPQVLRSRRADDRKDLADLRGVIGRLVARAFELLGITKQDAAYRMQYSDPGAISRWCSGTERPLFDKLFTIDGFEIAYVLAIAERNQAIEVDTVIRIRRTA